MTVLYANEVQTVLRELRGRNPAAYQLALRALRLLDRLGPIPDGRLKTRLVRFDPRFVCQLVFPRGGRTVLVRYEIDGRDSIVLTIVVTNHPRW